jgi:lipopolysaccharide/colanic/teichoic acid biosynthesis glycosyltransferase
MGKRVFDIAASSLLLLFLSPVMALIAAFILVESGLPVLFSQVRIGRRFRPFRIWKFRSMRAGAGGARITVGGDRRVTRIGRILRAGKLDELPQLWNVLRGDMSLVGPRPELPEYVALYRGRYRDVLEIRPGVTDLASLLFHDEEAVLASADDPLRAYAERVLPRKLDLAEEYLQRRSTLLDCSILMRTLLVPFAGSRK